MATTAKPANNNYQKAGAILASVGTLYDAHQQSKEYRQIARLKLQAADDSLRIGKLKAGLIRREGRRFMGETVADYAGSGVLTTAGGSVAAVEEEIGMAVELDALNALWESESQASALQVESKALRKNAKRAQIKGVLDASATALGGFG